MDKEFKIGKDYIGVGVFAVIQNSADKILLAKKLKSEKRLKEYENMWSMPGGTVDLGETAESALIREIKEETGLEIKIKKFLGYNDYIKQDRHWIALNFLVHTELDNFINNEPDKIAEMRWFAKDDIPENISSFTEECLGELGYL